MSEERSVVARLRAFIGPWDRAHQIADRNKELNDAVRAIGDLSALAEEMRQSGQIALRAKADQTAERLGEDDVAARSLDYAAACHEMWADRIDGGKP